MLRQGMDTDNDVRTPALDDIADIADAARMKELAGLRTKAIDQPVVILHPVLLVSQQPVVDRHQLGREVMRFLDGPDDAHRVRFTLHKTLYASHDGRGRGAMAAARVGRDDENFWIDGFHVRTACGSGRLASALN